MSTTTSSQPVSLSKPVELWNTMPGWGIVTNLIPPELLAARKLRVVRRILLVAIVVVVLVLGAVYTLSWRQHSAAADELASAQDRTTSLTSSQQQFSAGVQVQSSIDSATKSLSALMATEVDTSSLFGDLRAELPADMTINHMSLVLNKTTTDTAGTGNPAGTLDTGSNAHIGTVTLSGNAPTIALVTSFVDKLSSVPGVVQPFPANVSVTAGSVSWSISLTVDAQRYSNRYATAKKDGN